MNYISEINKFYDWLETNPVSDSSIVLWHALMHINNKCGWNKEFAVAISTLELKTALSRSSVIRARNNLQQAGRLKFKSRVGQQSAIYLMIAFHTDTQSGTQTVTQTVTQSDTQTVTINKLNNTIIDSGEKPEAPKDTSEEKQRKCSQREKVFYDSLRPFLKTYTPEMIRSFYDYWRETNKGKTKMKFELEETWDLNLRLIKWERNQSKFNKGRSPIIQITEDREAIKKHAAAIADRYK